MRTTPVALALALLCACATPRPQFTPRGDPAAKARLVAAGNMLWQGCFACLQQGLEEYGALREVLTTEPEREAATVGFLRAALLLGWRERELGMADGGYLRRARQILGTREHLRDAFLPLIEAAEEMPSPVGQFGGRADFGARLRAVAFQEKLPTLLSNLAQRVTDDPLSAYAFIALACTFRDIPEPPPETLPRDISEKVGAPLLRYRASTCNGIDTPALQMLLQHEPRFLEAHYWLGERAVAERRLEDAETAFRQAYEWRPSWPAVTARLANLYFEFEEFERALDLYDETLASSPDFSEAMLGRVKALSLLGRHDAAVAAAESMLGGTVRVLPAEAYYWRAWNYLRLQRIDDAWGDIEESRRLSTGPEVEKLGGIIASGRQDTDTALLRFEAARKLNADDCEPIYFLGLTHGRRGEWTQTAEVFTAAASCLENAQRRLQQEIDRIGQLEGPEGRKQRQIARRQQQIEAAGRMLATSFFNNAVAYFNLGRFDDARRFATRVSDDEQFAERARALLKRLK